MKSDTSRSGIGIFAINVLALVGIWLLPKLIAANHLPNSRQETFTEAEARRSLALILGGAAFIGITGLSFRAVLGVAREARNAEDNLQATQQNLTTLQNKLAATEFRLRLTEGKSLSEGKAFTKDLGDSNLSVRLGAIYSLEQIATESERFHWTVMGVLTGFIQRNAPRSKATDGVPPVDIAAALSVIGRRSKGREERGHINLSRSALAGARLSGAFLAEADLSEANLSDANLNGADLGKADLSQADLTRAILNKTILNGTILTKAVIHDAELRQADLNDAHLRQAELKGADLTGASLHRASMTEADMSDAHLSGASLRGADLHGAILFSADLNGAELVGTNLAGANLRMADLTAANLTQANLIGANLRWATGLTQKQLDAAITDQTTQVDTPLRARKKASRLTFSPRTSSASAGLQPADKSPSPG